jgi:hypothetical protein
MKSITISRLKLKHLYINVRSRNIINYKKFMKKILFMFFSLAVLVWGLSATSAFAATQNAVWDSQTGTVYPQTGTVVDAVATPDDGLFVQMDVGSTIIMKFPGSYVAIPDGTSAPDLQVNTYDGIYQADAEISVSPEGTTWTSLGVFPDTANIDIDLDAESISYVKYVKIDQGNHYIDQVYPTLGFDLNAVVALYSSDVIPTPKEPTCSDGIKNQDETGIDVGGVCELVVEQVSCPAGTVQASSPMETISVPATQSTNTLSSSLLTNGMSYIIKTSGTYINLPYNKSDAEYTSIDDWGTHENGYDISPYFLGEGEFDLKVDNNFVDWGNYNPTHEYFILYTGTGASVNLGIFDGDSNTNTQHPEWYGDNTGNLSVDIYKCAPIAPPVIQACSPGYWKNHIGDQWPSPYTSGEQFSAVFENAFPGKTLLQVLQQGGGGLNALGRQVVGALLNAADTNVSYPLTEQDVIDAFNAVYPGTNTDYDVLKAQLEGYGDDCPLSGVVTHEEEDNNNKDDNNNENSCKDGGWKNINKPETNNGHWKNQGECVSYYAKQKNHGDEDNEKKLNKTKNQNQSEGDKGKKDEKGKGNKPSH